MAVRDDKRSFGLVTRVLHSVIFVLIVVQFALGWTFELFPQGSTARGAWIALHESGGLLLLLAGLAFVAWRTGNVRPSLSALPAWQRAAARTVHGLLYLLLLAQPLLGIALVTFGGHPVHFYGLQLGPYLVQRKALAAHLTTAHEWLALGLAATIGLHALATVFHRVVMRDDIMRRMWLGAED